MCACLYIFVYVLCVYVHDTLKGVDHVCASLCVWEKADVPVYAHGRSINELVKMRATANFHPTLKVKLNPTIWEAWKNSERTGNMMFTVMLADQVPASAEVPMSQLNTDEYRDGIHLAHLGVRRIIKTSIRIITFSV